MNKRILTMALAATAALSLTVPAEASVTIQDFTVTGPVGSGSFSLAFDDVTSTYSLSALDFTVAGGSTTFDTSNSEVISLAYIGFPNLLELGGNANGGAYNVGPFGTPVDDFAFDFDPSIVSQSDGFAYVNAPVDYTQYSSVAITELPEPSTWAMFLFGFGALGIAIRRRKSLALLKFA